MDFCKSLILLCSVLIAFWGCATTTTSAVKESLEPQEATVITGIDIQENAVTITANKPFIYTTYKPGDPYKMVIDFPDVTIGAFNKKIISNKVGITEIIPSQIESPSTMARLEMLLQTPSLVEQEYKSNVLTIKIKEEFSKREDPPKEIKVADLLREERALSPKRSNPNPDPPVQSSLPRATEITNISFDTTADAVKVLIKGNGSMIPNVFPLVDRIVIDIPDVVMNASIPSGVVSPVKGIRSGTHEDKVRIVIDFKEKTNFDVTAIGDTIVVTLKREPSVMAAEQMPGEPEEIKEPAIPMEGKCEDYLAGKENVNFDFQDQDIVPIFRLFADISGCNLFVHPDVKGKATMKFRDVLWNQALDTILKTFGLGKSIEGNIIRIAPHTVLMKESEDARKAEKAKREAEEELAPLERKTYRLVYANAEDVKQKLLGQTIGVKYDEATKVTKYEYSYDEKLRILSTRGTATADRTANVIVVADLPSKIVQVDDFIREIDQPTRQVLIEARIVEVNTNKERELGIQWGINMQSTNTLMSAGGLSGVPLTSTGPFTGGNYLVDFPATGVGPLSGSGITFGLIDAARTIGLDVQLSALASIGSAKIVTNPKIMTMDRQQARIMQGKSIPVRKLTTEGTVSTEFKDIAMELIVTPAITREQTLDLDIDIKKEELDPTIPSVEGVPGTDKKQAKTKVRIQDGETLVIGGLYKINTSDTEIGVPGLMKIPILGWLFKREKQMSSTSELMIFITPRIVITERKQ